MFNCLVRHNATWELAFRYHDSNYPNNHHCCVLTFEPCLIKHFCVLLLSNDQHGPSHSHGHSFSEHTACYALPGGAREALSGRAITCRLHFQSKEESCAEVAHGGQSQGADPEVGLLGGTLRSASAPPLGALTRFSRRLLFAPYDSHGRRRCL